MSVAQRLGEWRRFRESLFFFNLLLFWVWVTSAPGMSAGMIGRHCAPHSPPHCPPPHTWPRLLKKTKRRSHSTHNHCKVYLSCVFVSLFHFHLFISSLYFPQVVSYLTIFHMHKGTGFMGSIIVRHSEFGKLDLFPPSGELDGRHLLCWVH
jgi:hypothetical protein